MAPVTAEQVRTAHEEGRRAGGRGDPASPNPYAAEYVPPWRRPRTPAGRAEFEAQRRPALILARVWRRGYERGRAARERERARAER